MVRIRAFQARGPGSIPGRRKHARLAQSVERKTLNLVVVGSSPTVGTALVLFWFGLVSCYICILVKTK